MDIEKAIQEVDFIKKVLKKTKTDFSLISMFFIKLELLNLWERYSSLEGMQY